MVDEEVAQRFRACLGVKSHDNLFCSVTYISLF